MLYLNMGEPIVYKPPGFFMGFLAIFSFIIFKFDVYTCIMAKQINKLNLTELNWSFVK